MFLESLELRALFQLHFWFGRDLVPFVFGFRTGFDKRLILLVANVLWIRQIVLLTGSTCLRSTGGLCFQIAAYSKPEGLLHLKNLQGFVIADVMLFYVSHSISSPLHWICEIILRDISVSFYFTLCIIWL